MVKFEAVTVSADEQARHTVGGSKPKPEGKIKAD